VYVERVAEDSPKRRRKKRRRRRRRNVLECSYFVCEILDFHGDEYSNSGVTVVTPED